VTDVQKRVAQWQAAYRSYTEAHEANRYAAVDDPRAAARIAPAYRRVAWLWRQLAAEDGAPWWAKAAAVHAAELFDHQAEVNEQIASGNKASAGHHQYAPVSGEGAGDGSTQTP